MTTKVLVCGAREWTDENLIRWVLGTYPSDTLVIHGDNGNNTYTVGADRIAHVVAKSLFDINPKPCPAEWKKYGQSAGPRRNRQMLDEEKPDVVLAFHNNIKSSKGTKDCVKAARERNIPVVIYAQDGYNDLTDNKEEWVKRNLF